jgi:hypothetical protein
MKCRFCKTEIDTSKSEIIDEMYASWYGRYTGSGVMVEVTCLSCLRENREAWGTMSDETRERLKKGK